MNAAIPRLNPVRESVFGGDDPAIRDFAARRLLDKLMYYEGALLRKHPGDPCGAAAQETVGQWIKGLKSDIEAAGDVNQHPDAAD